MKNSKAMILIFFYSIFVILLFYFSTISESVSWLFLLPYELGGALVITYVVGKYVQRFNKTHSHTMRLINGIIVLISPIIGYVIRLSYRNSNGVNYLELLDEDTYMTCLFSFVGVMCGQIIEAIKKHMISKKM